MLKLLSASARQAKKDIYDLDLITDDISLAQLLELLKERQLTFVKEHHKSLFDLDNDPNPLESIKLLLEFDNIDYSSTLSPLAF